MATQNFETNGTWLAVAGTGAATISAHGSDVTWALDTAVPDQALVGHTLRRGESRDVTVPSGAHLFVRGYEGALLGVDFAVAPAMFSKDELEDQTFTENTGVQTYDVSGDFIGGYPLVFEISTNPDATNITIDAETGIISFDTDELAVSADDTVEITATNSSDNGATSTFLLTIEAE